MANETIQKENKIARKEALFSEWEETLYSKGEITFHKSNLNDFTTHLLRPENIKRATETPTDFQKISQQYIRLYVLSEEELRNRKQPLSHKPDANRADLRGFIFNPDEIVKLAMFSSHLLDEDTFAFGVLLPKTESLHTKKGDVMGHHQVWRPVVITSLPSGIPYSLLMENTYKVRYITVPEEMRLRWELPSIEAYLNGNAPHIDGHALFNAVRDRYAYYCYYRVDEWYDVNALWDIGTYLHQLFATFPLKEERGMPGTAKTKTMVVSSYMTLNATDIMVNPSEATLFRETEASAPTKYIDEAEKLFTLRKGGGMEADNRVELINASYSKNGTVPRQEKIGKNYVTKWYHVYSPTRISSINGLWGATETRSITQVHTKAPDKDGRGEREPEADAASAVWANIRNDLYIWALQNWKLVQEAYSNFEIETSLKKRDLQLWKPLMAVASVIDAGMLPKIIKFAELLAEQRKMDSMPEGSLDYQLLDCLSQLIPADKDQAHIAAILAKLNEKYPLEKPRSKGFNKTISSHLDKLGFAERKRRDSTGMYYELSEELYNEIILTINPQFATSTTLSTSTEENNQTKMKQSVENVESIGNSNVANEAIVENVANPDLKHISTKNDPPFLMALKNHNGEMTKEVVEAEFGLGFWRSEAFDKFERSGDIFLPRQGIVKLVRCEAIE